MRKLYVPFFFLVSFISLVFSQENTENLENDYVWNPLKIGGGGWVVGMDIHPTEQGLLYIRTDVSGAYRWNPQTSYWERIVTTATMPAEYNSYGSYEGVHSLVGAPGNPDIAYMAYKNQIFKSWNRGDKWFATSFGIHGVSMNSNGAGRQEGERLAVDPNNSEVLYYGSENDQLWTSHDGGNNWSKISTIPQGKEGHGVNTIVFDKGSGVTNTKTNVIYVTVDDGGVFKTSDAGLTWNRISDSGPGTHRSYRDAEIGSDGMYYVIYTSEGNDGEGAVWKYLPSGQWINITPEGNQPYTAIAVDPTNKERIVVMKDGGKTWVSANQGNNWSSHDFNRRSTSVGYLGRQTDHWLSIGEIKFDPFEPGKLWFAEGFGVWWANNLSSNPIDWNEESKGIEETCGNAVISPPGGKPVTAMWDLGAFFHENTDQYYAQRSQSYFLSCWSLDWCPADPDFLVGTFQSHHPNQPVQNKYSVDGGRSWTVFPSVPENASFGCITVSADDKNNIVWLPSNDQLPYYTTDRGVSWKQCNFGGLTNSGYNSYTSPRKPLCADRVQPSTFYYQNNDGIYRSLDAGANWSKVAANPVPNCWNITMKTVPGHTGEIWLAEGKQGNIVGGLWRSRDGGETWNAVHGLEQVFSFGFGKPERNGEYPTVFATGVLNGEHGIYRSTDSGNKWVKIGTYPLGINDYVDDMDGDKNVFGKVYICFAGSGFCYGTVESEEVPEVGEAVVDFESHTNWGFWGGFQGSVETDTENISNHVGRLIYDGTSGIPGMYFDLPQAYSRNNMKGFTAKIKSNYHNMVFTYSLEDQQGGQVGNWTSFPQYLANGQWQTIEFPFTETMSGIEFTRLVINCTTFESSLPAFVLEIDDIVLVEVTHQTALSTNTLQTKDVGFAKRSANFHIDNVRFISHNGTLNISGLSKDTMIRIYSSIGSVLYQSKQTEDFSIKLNTRSISPRLFFVELNDGTSRITKKIFF